VLNPVAGGDFAVAQSALERAQTRLEVSEHKQTD
jgi:hypothetical protein